MSEEIEDPCTIEAGLKRMINTLLLKRIHLDFEAPKWIAVNAKCDSIVGHDAVDSWMLVYKFIEGVLEYENNRCK